MASSSLNIGSGLLRGMSLLAPGLAARAMAEMATRPGGRNSPQPWELGPGPVAREIEYEPGQYAQAWGESGPLVLALHGWRGRPSQFRPLAARLVSAGFRVIGLDAPGHGRSKGKRVSPVILGRQLARAVSALGPVHAAVGHSFGGAAIGVAIAEGLRLSRIALVASPTRASQLPLRFAAELGLTRRAIARMPALLDAHSGRPAAELDLVAGLPSSGVAALVVHDRDDAVIPYADAELLLRAAPGIELMSTQGLGHRDLLVDAQVLDRLVGFLQQ